jgi:hypothetical protein
MSGSTPSWLLDEPVEDVAKSIAKNPVAQKAAIKAASDPRVQQAALSAAKTQAPNAPSWAEEHTADRGSGGNGGFGNAGNSAFANADDVEVGVGGKKAGGVGADGKRVNPYAALVAATPKEQLASMRTYHGFLRLLYVAVSCFMAAVAVKTFQLETNTGLLFFSFYIFVFSLLICCFETQYFSIIARFLAINFGFMYSITGRWTFLLFVGFMCYFLGDLGIAAMSSLYFAGVCHAILMYKFPIFPTYQRMLHFDLQNPPVK